MFFFKEQDDKGLTQKKEDPEVDKGSPKHGEGADWK